MFHKGFHINNIVDTMVIPLRVEHITTKGDNAWKLPVTNR